MSQVRMYPEKAPQNLEETIAENFIAKLRPLLLDFMDQKQFHSAEISQGGKDSRKAPQSLTVTVAAKITEGFQKADSLFSSACIYRVPEELRKLKESAYTPRLIAIGPLHRNDKHLQTPIQHLKLSYTNYLFCRLTEGIEDIKSAEEKKFVELQVCLEKMKVLIGDAKKCYAEEVTLDEQMMLVDGCFILELLYRCSFSYKQEGGDRRGKSKPLGGENSIRSSNIRNVGDPIFASHLTFSTVQHDLLLLENQIPFFVLNALFKLTVARIPSRFPEYLLSDYVSLYFGDMMNSKSSSEKCDTATTTTSCSSPSDVVLSVFGNQKKNSHGGVGSTNDDYYHILHKLHEDYLPDHEPKDIKEDFKPMPSASNLKYAGIKFVHEGKDLFNDVKFIKPKGPFQWFQRACFKMPTLKIYHHTEAFLRNLIAFEQCCPGSSEHFTSYAYLMDMLVNTETDAKVLERAKVLCNYMGASEEATDLFDKLCKEIIPGKFFFADECTNATEYSELRWPKFMAQLRRKYFASPWTFIAFCLASIVFGTTIIQFILNFINKNR